MSAYAHLDRRTRPPRSGPPIEPASFWEDAWAAAIASHGERAAADAAHLGLGPIALRVEDQAWTLTPGPDGLALRTGAPADEAVELDRAAFTELISGRRTAMGLAVAGQLAGTPAAIGALCAWDAVLRSLLEGRSLYRPGDIALRARDGSPLALERRFTLEPDEHDNAAHFLAEAGYLVLQGVFADEELDRADAELAAAVADATPDDGTSWWASTRDGTRYPCRILDLADRSPAARELLRSPAFLAIGDLLGLGHRPGDPFGEHFARPTIEGLTKRVDSVDGLVCLPWHHDCERGGHSTYCCGITVGICLTPVDEEHGGLDVYAGSHRANIARAQFDRDLDLPIVSVRAQRGDVTVHLSCTLHRSTHPTTRERRVAYTGFALPPMASAGAMEVADAADPGDADRWRVRSAIGATPRAQP